MSPVEGLIQAVSASGIEQVPQEMEEPVLGDCILHLDHHPMTGECWDAAIERYAAFIESRSGTVDITSLGYEAMLVYKHDYERALLWSIMREAMA